MWPGSYGICRFCEDEGRPLIRGADVLDFATGCGAAAVAAKRAGARSVLLNDIDPWSTLIAKINMGMNDEAGVDRDGPDIFDTNGECELRETTQNLIGRAAGELFPNEYVNWSGGASSAMAPRVVLAGDVCYEEVLAGQVIDWLRDMAAHDGVTVRGDGVGT